MHCASPHVFLMPSPKLHNSTPLLLPPPSLNLIHIINLFHASFVSPFSCHCSCFLYTFVVAALASSSSYYFIYACVCWNIHSLSHLHMTFLLSFPYDIASWEGENPPACAIFVRLFTSEHLAFPRHCIAFPMPSPLTGLLSSPLPRHLTGVPDVFSPSSRNLLTILKEKHQTLVHIMSDANILAHSSTLFQTD